MNEWLVVAGGLAAIVWVNWYFLVAGRRPVAVPGRVGGSREVTITVDGGYEPASIRVPAGETVRLLFDRRDTSPCSEEVVFPDFGIRRFLPTGKTTSIEITPAQAGEVRVHVRHEHASRDRDRGAFGIGLRFPKLDDQWQPPKRSSFE